MVGSPPVRVAIAEDHALVAEALATMFSLVDGFDVVGRVVSGEDACILSRQTSGAGPETAGPFVVPPGRVVESPRGFGRRKDAHHG